MKGRIIDCPEVMTSVVKELGIVPFFRNCVPGWSIEEMTAPGFWWDTEGVLGPWDWKIVLVQDGIAYGKFLGGKVVFATREWYQKIMAYKRVNPKYRIALGEFPKGKAKTSSEKLLRFFAPIVLDAIKQNGGLQAKNIRGILSESVTPSLLRSMGAKYKPLLSPVVKKSISDTVIGYLQSGTWIVTGDLERVYRGANLTYSGWQLASFTTPESFWGEEKKSDAPEHVSNSDMPSWTKRFEMETTLEMKQEELSPEEAFRQVFDHIMELYPDADPVKLEKFLR